MKKRHALLLLIASFSVAFCMPMVLKQNVQAEEYYDEDGEENDSNVSPEAITLRAGKKKYIDLSNTLGVNSISFELSNPGVATVTEEYRNGKVIARKPGTTVVSVYYDGEYAGQCTVTVTKPRAPKKVLKQMRPSGYTSYDSDNWPRARHNKITIHYLASPDDFDFNVPTAHYEIYRSRKRNSGYKKIKTTSGFSFDYTDRKVKPNRKYYYKVRYKPGYANCRSSFTKPVAYYTAPKPIRYKSRKGNVYRWKKVKGASRYLVIHVDGVTGYNIFGVEVTNVWSNYRPIKGTKIKVSPGSYIERTIAPMARHGGYYYCSGYPIRKSLSYYKYYDDDDDYNMNNPEYENK